MSLLGGVLWRRGLLGDEPRAPELARPGTGPQITGPVAVPKGPPGLVKPTAMSLYDRLKMQVGDAVSGGYDSRLSAQDNAEAQKMATIRSGLAMMAASGARPGGPANLGEILLAGMNEGQAAGGQSRERAYLRTAEDRIDQALRDPEVTGSLTKKQIAHIRALPPAEAMKLLTSLAFAPAPSPVAVAEGTDLIDPTTGQMLYTNDKPAERDEELPADLRAALWEMGVDASALTPEQRAQAMGRYAELKRTGATSINIGDRQAQQEFVNTNTIASQYRGEIAEHQEVANSYGRVLAAAQDPTVAGDIALIFAYMKMLDPGSAVREGEQATAQNAGSIPGTIRAKYNQLFKGSRRLDPELHLDYVDRARRLAEQKQGQIKPIMRRYRNRVVGVDVDPDSFIFDPFAELGIEPAPAGFGDLIPKQ